MDVLKIYNSKNQKKKYIKINIYMVKIQGVWRK